MKRSVLVVAMVAIVVLGGNAAVAAARQPVDACRLVSLSDARRVLGESAVTNESMLVGPGPPACGFTSFSERGTLTPSSLVVHVWKGPKSQFKPLPLAKRVGTDADRV